MPNCEELEPLVTAWIDGVATDQERRLVEGHLRACGPCRAHAESEASARAVIRDRATGTPLVEAPAALKARCRSLASLPSPETGSPTSWAEVLRVPIAATLLLALGGLLLYGLTVVSPATLAAQLTADHVKCFAIASDHAHLTIDPDAVEGQLNARYGWDLDLPGDSEANGLRLVGSRRCLYGEGTIAHVLYRHDEKPLSLFMLPDTLRRSEIVEVLGHCAIMWSVGDRTFVLLGGQPREEMEKIAAYIQSVVK